MSGRVQDRVAIVFGGGSVGEGWGNGKAAAVTYAREGAKVVVVDRNADAAEETRRIIAEEGNDAIAVAADVTRFEDIETAVGRNVERYGRIDILHNNVGITAPGGPVEASEESWDRVMDVNLKSVFFTCKAVLPIMEKQRAGAIVNISSIASIRWTGYPYSSYYASKSGLNGFTRGIAMEYADKGIRANTILPGLMDTPHIYQQITTYYDSVDEMVAQRAAVTPMKFMGNAWDIANAALFLASDESRYITGVELCVDGGLHCKFA
jgi:NAD(P)-dependent dehydrogenase (short-subunit alcohol dehydrogenase family)